jgi:urease accessory protein UreE
MPLYNMLLEVDLITLFIDFVLEKASPLSLVAKKYSLGNKHNPVSFHAAIDLILTLYKRVNISLFSRLGLME